jgi:LmbE family N-acetylglucosaminyl deacetylase
VRRRLAAVFAHPDDDTFGLGGTLATDGEDIDYTLIVATSGEAGMIADPTLASQANLAEVREGEEREALRELGVGRAEVHFLHHPDGRLSEVARQALVAAIVRILEQAAPQVVVTFGPEGITRHDDHIAIGQAATEAFHEARATAGDGTFERLFYVAIPQSDLDAYWAAVRAEGIDPGDPDAPFQPRGVPDHTITARFDGRRVWATKWRALQAHRTQAPEVDAIPERIRVQSLAFESFVQAWPPVTDPRAERLFGLFDGLP